MGAQQIDSQVILPYLIKYSDTLRDLETQFVKLKKIIESEQRYIALRDIEHLEEITKEKNLVSENIEASKNSIGSITKHISTIFPQYQEPMESLSNLMAFFEWSMRNQENRNLLIDNIIMQNLSAAQNHLKGFLKTVKIVKPLIEQNKYLTQELLFSYQDNLRVWQETLDSCQKSYTSRGEQPISGDSPMFYTKA